MKIQARIVADSIHDGNRITTFILTYPRIIHAEFMTHRMFSRNAASSRAVPAEKLIKTIEEEPFIPLAFQKNHKGMQGTEYITNQEDIDFEIRDWLDDRDYAVKKAKARLARGVTKQLVNRPLEPFQYYTCVCTATEWENFFALRCSRYTSPEVIGYYRSKKDYLIALGHSTEKEYTQIEWLSLNKGQAEIHMMALAEAMWDAYNESIPKELKEGEWHIPFGDKIDESQFTHLSSEQVHNTSNEEYVNLIEKEKIKIATARCARVSYTVVGEEGKEANYENDIKLHDKLLESRHMSPFEHCAEAKTSRSGVTEWYGNFAGWRQLRKMIPNENIAR